VQWLREDNDLPTSRCLALAQEHQSSSRSGSTTWRPLATAEIRLVNVLAIAQPGAPHAAAIEDMSKTPLDHFAAPARGLLSDRRV
jgi:hypothetical protein